MDKDAANLVEASLPMRMRIQRDIECLRKESVEQSLAMLSEVGMFYWPGVPSNGGMVRIPLSGDEERQTVQRVLSNRRVLKLIDELSQMPSEKAAALVARQIDSSLPAYKILYAKYRQSMMTVQEASRGAPEAGVSIQVSNNEDHSPTLAGLRLQLLSLVLIAGNLELTSSAKQIDGVVEQALGERDELYDEKGINPALRFGALKDVSLYNRCILCTGLAGTDREKSADAQWDEYRLTKFDAAATKYDMLTRGGGPIPTDFSKGEVHVRVVKGADDKDVRRRESR